VKLHLNQTQHLHTITSCDVGSNLSSNLGSNLSKESKSIAINAIKYHNSLWVTPSSLITDCAVDGQALTTSNLDGAFLDKLLADNTEIPEVILIGTGIKQVFIHPKHLGKLYEKHIGVECMDTAAACRTYNVLMAEDRKVAALLIIE
jgi:uncharacterized protein